MKEEDMAEIGLSDKTMLKVEQSVTELKKLLEHDRFVQITDRDRDTWEVNPAQIVWMRDN
jgi:hypothetical protein